MGGDGQMLVWSLDRRRGALNMERGFTIRARDMPRALHLRSKRDKVVNLTCAAAMSTSTGIVLGCDTGVIFYADPESDGDI